MRSAILVLALAAPLLAQEVRPPGGFERLAAKAEESVDVTLDGSMLRLASRFLSDKNRDEAGARKVLSGLESLAVHSYRFRQEGGYDRNDVDAVRAQFRTPDWFRMVGVRSKECDCDVDIYIKSAAGGNVGGIVVVAAEPRELTIVQVAGTIDPAQLMELGGHYGIPELAMNGKLTRWKGPE